MTRYCLWCHEEIIQILNWKSVVMMPKPTSLCERCEQQMESLNNESIDRCRQCSRESKRSICLDCLWWKKYFSENDPLQFNRSVFKYNDFMQAMIAKWKYRGDYVLAKMFQTEFTNCFKREFSFLDNAIIVPIPLSEERLKERRFNQAEQLANFLPLPVKNVLSRSDSEKRAKKSRQERIREKNPFTIDCTINKPVVLVDDIYTTGSTIRHAAKVITKQGSPYVYAYTLIRG